MCLTFQGEKPRAVLPIRRLNITLRQRPSQEGLLTPDREKTPSGRITTSARGTTSHHPVAPDSGKKTPQTQPVSGSFARGVNGDTVPSATRRGARIKTHKRKRGTLRKADVDDAATKPRRAHRSPPPPAVPAVARQLRSYLATWRTRAATWPSRTLP